MNFFNCGRSRVNLLVFSVDKHGHSYVFLLFDVVEDVRSRVFSAGKRLTLVPTFFFPS